MAQHLVHLILDPSFEGDLWALSRSAHVWIVASPTNEPYVETVRSADTRPYSASHGVTTFRDDGEPILDLYCYLGTIDLHHGEYAATRPWDIINVIGIALDEVSPNRICEELRAPVVLERTSSGFEIVRSRTES